MATWKKILVSGSSAELLHLTASGKISASLGFQGDLVGTSSYATSVEGGTLASSKFYVGNASGVTTAVVMSGDATMDNTGAVSITLGANSIDSDQYVDGSIDTAHIGDEQITLAKLAHAAANTVLVRDANSTGDPSFKAVTNTQILIGDGTGFTAAELSGDATMTNAGVVSIVNDKVITAKILDANVTTAKLANDAVNADKLASNAVVNASVAAAAAIVQTKIDTDVDLGGDITFGDQPDDTVMFTGHISSSVTSTGSFGAIETPYGINFTDDLSSGEGARLYFTNAGAKDTIILQAGTRNMLEIQNPISTGVGEVVVNEDSLVVNFRVETNGNDNMIFTDGTNDKVGIGKGSPGEVLEVFGNISASGTIRGSSLIGTASYATSAQGGTLASTNFYVGNGSNVTTAVAMSGDVTMDNAGEVTIGAETIDSDQYVDGSIDTAHIGDEQVTLAKMAHMAANTVLVRNANSTGDPSAVAVTNTQILIGDGTGFTAAALSGDVSMTNAGAVAIVNDKVITAKILDANVTTAKLANDAVNADKLASNAVVNASVATGAAIVLTKIDTAVDLGGDITFGDQPDDTVIFSGHLQVDGDLLVSGDTTTLHTANLMVEDKFILLASSSGAPNVDGGIIVQTTNLKGTALGWDDSAKRWGVSGRDETSHDATSFAPKQYLTTVSQSTDGPVGVTVGDFGTSDALRAGMMHVETDTGEIYIFS